MDSNIIFNTIDYVAKWQNIKNEIAVKKRMLFLECKQNLSLIASFKIDSCRQDDPDLKFLVNNLSTDVLQLIFFEAENKSIIKLLSIKKEFNSEMEKRKKKTKSNPIVFAFTKILTLKKLINIKQKGNALKKINFRIRIKNINFALSEIINALKNDDDVKYIMSPV